MGQFSWLDCNDSSQILCDPGEECYLLNPFGSNYFEESYSGYGRFGKVDAYEEVIRWNREFIAEHPDFKDSWNNPISSKSYYEDLCNEELSLEEVAEKNKTELRIMGIDIACLDSQNEKLRFPIKICHEDIPYNRAGASETDPNQGWKMEEDDEEEYY